jgi:hypothetical protein
MNHPNRLEGCKDDQRLASAPLAATGGLTSLARTRWAMPTATPRNTAADAIADDPAKLCLAGRLISWATAGNDVRFEKVASLRQAIEAGTYNISSADLADKLIDGLRG